MTELLVLLFDSSMHCGRDELELSSIWMPLQSNLITLRPPWHCTHYSNSNNVFNYLIYTFPVTLPLCMHLVASKFHIYLFIFIRQSARMWILEWHKFNLLAITVAIIITRDSQNANKMTICKMNTKSGPTQIHKKTYAMPCVWLWSVVVSIFQIDNITHNDNIHVHLTVLLTLNRIWWR